MPEETRAGAAAPRFQVMPVLDAEALAALEQDILARGIVVPVVEDQHGRLLDGHHRREIAQRLSIACPVEVRPVDDDEDARQVALALNLTRRHLSREQRRHLIARECEERPTDSDRAIARRLGCSPSTVAAVRRQGVSKLDTAAADDALVFTGTTVEAEELTEKIRAGLDSLDECLVQLPRLMAVRALTGWWRQFEDNHRGDEDFLGPLRQHVYEPRLDCLLTAGATATSAEEAVPVGG